MLKSDRRKPDSVAEVRPAEPGRVTPRVDVGVGVGVGALPRRDRPERAHLRASPPPPPPPSDAQCTLSPPPRAAGPPTSFVSGVDSRLLPPLSRPRPLSSRKFRHGGTAWGCGGRDFVREGPVPDRRGGGRRLQTSGAPSLVGLGPQVSDRSSTRSQPIRQRPTRGAARGRPV